MRGQVAILKSTGALRPRWCYGLLLLRFVARIIQSRAGDALLRRGGFWITQLLTRELGYARAGICILSHGHCPFWHCPAKKAPATTFVGTCTRSVAFAKVAVQQSVVTGSFRLDWNIQPGRFLWPTTYRQRTGEVYRSKSNWISAQAVVILWISC